jgi:hypothetical protein
MTRIDANAYDNRMLMSLTIPNNTAGSPIYLNELTCPPTATGVIVVAMAEAVPSPIAQVIVIGMFMAADSSRMQTTWRYRAVGAFSPRHKFTTFLWMRSRIVMKIVA